MFLPLKLSDVVFIQIKNFKVPTIVGHSRIKYQRIYLIEVSELTLSLSQLMILLLIVIIEPLHVISNSVAIGHE